MGEWISERAVLVHGHDGVHSQVKIEFYELTLDHAHTTSDRARGRESHAGRMRPPDVQRKPHTRRLFSPAYSSKSQQEKFARIRDRPDGRQRATKEQEGAIESANKAMSEHAKLHQQR